MLTVTFSSLRSVYEENTVLVLQGLQRGNKKRDMKKNYNVAFMEEDERFVLFLLFLPTSKMLFIVQKKV